MGFVNNEAVNMAETCIMKERKVLCDEGGQKERRESITPKSGL